MKRFRFYILLVASLGLLGCRPANPAEAFSGGPLGIRNYTDSGVEVDVELKDRGTRGTRTSVGPGSGTGIGSICCVPTPDIWQPGYFYTIRYRFFAKDAEVAGPWLEQRLELAKPPGGKAGGFAVSVYGIDEIEIDASGHTPKSSGYPGRIKRFPEDLRKAELGTIPANAKIPPHQLKN